MRLHLFHKSVSGMAAVFAVTAVVVLPVFGEMDEKAMTRCGMPVKVRAEVSAAVSSAAARPHPRLFADSAGFAALKSRIEKDRLLKAGTEFVRARADAVLDTDPVRYDQAVRIHEGDDGLRFFNVTAPVLGRINALALAYRLYGDRRHLDRALAELRAVCSFKDWNPCTYLNTAEFALAVAVGYDWLHGDMGAEDRKTIAGALRRLGMDPSLKWCHWVRGYNNWGQVCHAGVLAAALAVAEDDPDCTARFVQRCIDCIPFSMKSYAPNGNYPEGPGYWYYGTEFNVVAIAILESALGDDFGLASLPGFKETGYYLDLTTGPSGLMYNYVDADARRRRSSMATWWFAMRFGCPDMLTHFEEKKIWDTFTDSKRPSAISSHDNLLPYALFWMGKAASAAKRPAPLVWDSKGKVPIVIQRSSWNDEKALFVGLKGGSPSDPHGHMDGGSFVLESEGVRWALDLGLEPYQRLEKMGVDLWPQHQTSQRWDVFRLGTSSHNVPMIDGCQQAVNGTAKVLEVKGKGPNSMAALDLSTLYTNAVSVVRMGTMQGNGRGYLLRDRFTGVRPNARIRWAMMTGAEPKVSGNSVTLRQSGRKITLTQCGSQRGRWIVLDGQGPEKWDSPTPGCRQLTFTVDASADGSADLAVRFTF